MLTLFCALAFSWQSEGGPVQKADLPVFLKTKGAAEAKAFSDKRIRQLESQLTAAKQARIGRGSPSKGLDGSDGVVFFFKSQSEKAAKVKEIERQIKEARDLGRQPFLPTLTPATLAVGQVGCFRSLRIEPALKENESTVLISKVIEGRGVVVHSGDPGAAFLLVIDTTGLVDLRPLAIDRSECFEVVGTTSVLGRTMFEVKPFDWREYIRGHAK